MCGIAGTVTFTGTSPETASRIRKATDAMLHRGPDAGGLWESPDHCAIFGHRRLSIIDLSARADQPFVDPESGVALVFNGEIYNFSDIRPELELHGCRFRTASDTEVLLAAYLVWQEKMFDHLEGMFAFGIWDPRDRSLLLARDFCGQKPLYFASSSGTVSFASEMNALRALRPDLSSVDETSVYSYLQYFCVPAPGTMIKGIRKVPAGHYYRVTEHGECLTRYWHPVAASRRWNGIARTEADWEQLIASELKASVVRTCVADVPVGVAFSGGSDSVAVAASALSVQQQLSTFSIDINSMGDPEERSIRSKFSQWAGIRHHSAQVAQQELREWVSTHLRCFDEPVADNTIVFSAVLSSAFRKNGYKVFLTGEGGDEVFIGYPWWVRMLRWQQRIRFAGRAAGFASSLVPSQYRNKAVVRLMQRARSGGGNVFWDSQLGLPPAVAGTLMTGTPQHDDSFLQQLRQSFLDQGGSNETQWFTWLDVNLRLPELLLLRLDRASMQASTEARSPLLDRPLVELSMAIPEHIKLKHARPKSVFFGALRREVPDDLIIRKKIGYNHGVRGELPSVITELRESVHCWNRSAGLLRQPALEHVTAGLNSDSLWPLYALSEWHRAAAVA